MSIHVPNHFFSLFHLSYLGADLPIPILLKIVVGKPRQFVIYLVGYQIEMKSAPPKASGGAGGTCGNAGPPLWDPGPGLFFFIWRDFVCLLLA
jgi:hypothetical protein